MPLQPVHIAELKEVIVSRIVRILDQVYHEPLEDATPAAVAAQLAFKADPHLNELRLALERIERDEYGTCIFCKGDIPVPVLRDLPTAHFCEHCATTLKQRTEAARSRRGTRATASE